MDLDYPNFSLTWIFLPVLFFMIMNVTFHKSFIEWNSLHLRVLRTAK
jgi:hypothetical protein